MSRNFYQKLKNFHQFYLVGLILLLLILAIFIWQNGSNLFATFNDFSYHLAVAQGYVRAKGVVTWDFWESLPIGRSHNYPPLLHIILAGLIKAGLAITIAEKIIIELVIVGGFILFAYGLAKIFNLKIAFWAVFLSAMSFSFIKMSATVLPASLVYFCSPIIYYFAIRKRFLSLFALYVMLLYAHLFMVYFVVAPLFIYLFLFDKKLFFSNLKIFGIALLFYLPWLINVGSDLFSIKYFDAHYNPAENGNTFLTFNLIILFFTLSLFYFAKYKKQEFEFKPVIFFTILFFFALPVIYMSTDRACNGHMLVPLSILGAVAINCLFKIKYLNYFILIILIFYLFKTPTAYLVHYKSLSLGFNSSTISKVIESRLTKTKMLDEEFLPVFKIIQQNTKPGESLVSLSSGVKNNYVASFYPTHLSNFFAANSNLSNLNLRQPEIFYRDAPDIKQARILILDQSPSQIDQTYLVKYGQESSGLVQYIRNNFEVISIYNTSKSLVYICRNNSPAAISETLPKFRFPLWLAEFLIGLFCLIVLLGNLKINKRKCFKNL